MKLLSVFILLFSLVFMSCTNTIKLGMIGTRNIDYSAKYQKAETSESKGEIMFLLFIPLKVQDQHPIEILDQALEKGGYDFMTDVEVSQTNIGAILFTYTAFKVKGTGWKKVDEKVAMELNNKAFIVSEDYSLKPIPDELKTQIGKIE